MVSSRGIETTGRPAHVAVAPSTDDPATGTPPQELVHLLMDGFKRNDLLTYASAISFQILTAIIPFLLFILAVAGLFNLDGVWRDHLEPQIRANVSSQVFAVIDNGVA